MGQCAGCLDSVLLFDFQWEQRIIGEGAALQIGAVHIYGGNLRVAVGGIVVDAEGGIAAGGINSDLILAGGHLTAAAHLLHAAKDVEELTDTFCLILAAYRVHASESGPYKAGIGGQIAGQAFGTHATAVAGQLHPGGKGILWLAGRKATVAVQNGHLLWERGIIGEDTDGIIVNVQPIRHALHHNGAGGIGDEPVQGSGRQSLTEGGAGQIHAGQGGTGFPQIGAMGQNPGDEFKLGDIFLSLAGGGIGGIANKIEPGHAKTFLIDGIIVEGVTIGHIRHADDGVVFVHVAGMAERKRKAAGRNGYFAGVGKFIIQSTAKIKITGLIGGSGTHFIGSFCTE